MQKLTLIQQNDTHGCLEMHDELYWQANGPVLKKAGGFARIANYVKEVKRENDNVLFFDGGDLFHGTLPLVSSKGEAILPLLEQMELDGFIPGNWDFAYGKDQLKHLVERLPFPALACNVFDEVTGEPLLHPYLIKEMQGMTAGIIGLTYPYVDITMPGNFSEGLQFSRGVEEVRDIVNGMKGEVDVVVLVSHMGLPLDAKLATLVSGIDVILSGHSHDRVTKPIITGETLIVQAGSSSSFLGRLDITMDNGKVTDADYRLIDMDETIREDGEMKEIVQIAMEPYRMERETIAGDTNSILHRMTLNEAPMDRFLTDAYRHAFECDLAFSHGWRYGSPKSPGALSIEDLYSIIPTNPEMFTLEMDGHTLWQTLEKNLEQVFSDDPFQQKGGYILRSSGLLMTFKPYNPKGYRIQTMQIGGQDLDLHKTYKLAGGGQQLFKAKEVQKTYHGTHAIDVVRSFLKEKGPYETGQMGNIVSV